LRKNLKRILAGILCAVSVCSTAVFGAGCGGGKAPGGLCGALYAALALAPESEHENIKASFAEKAGALTCCEIKSTTLFPCAECVRVAAELTEKYL
jgi:hypothetical protein